jgi:hypothetical protein
MNEVTGSATGGAHRAADRGAVVDLQGRVRVAAPVLGDDQVVVGEQDRVVAAAAMPVFRAVAVPSGLECSTRSIGESIRGGRPPRIRLAMSRTSASGPTAAAERSAADTHRSSTGLSNVEAMTTLTGMSTHPSKAGRDRLDHPAVRACGTSTGG